MTEGERGEMGATGKTGDTGATELVPTIKRTLTVLVVATLVLYGLVAVIGIKAFHDAGQNKDALCALRADLEKRVDVSKTFLIDNPKGIPGISAKAIRDGIANQERTIKALGNLNC